MLGALIGVALLLLLSGSRSSLVTFVLAGAILNIVASAGISLALSLAPSPWAVGEIVDWLMGSLQDRSVDEVRLAAPFILAGAALLLTTGRALDALTLGEAGARSLGISLRRTRWTLALGVGLATGAAVAVSGVIGFVGLVVPHVLRPLVGARPGALLAPSALGGAVLVLAADVLVRVTPAAGEVKLGVAMAALGGPFFLALLLTLRRRIA
jgi:iron complex transport system permease protein